MTIVDRFRLDGKVALVTGCRQGIGRGCAQALADAGADVIGVGRRELAGSEVEKDVTALGRNFSGYVCDFSDRRALYIFIDQVTRDFPCIDILVNSAGSIARKPVAEHPDEGWDEVIAVNLTAGFILSREIGKGMLVRGRGKIVFIASLLSFQGGLTVPGYTASKGGLRTLVMAMANEWSSRGVNVNAIVPGYIATDLNTVLRADPVRGGQILERIPAGRWGTPDDLKGAVVFLSSEASDYVHGTTLVVDGGWLGR
jgi:2-deoxy-D-gluconate 3-dehydrogenase